jgi:hypothetical protein
MIWKHRRAWAEGSPGATVSRFGPIGAVPETTIRLPVRTALENPIRASYGLPLETRSGFIGTSAFWSYTALPEIL